MRIADDYGDLTPFGYVVFGAVIAVFFVVVVSL